jgi:hypothetical protein
MKTCQILNVALNTECRIFRLGLGCWLLNWDKFQLCFAPVNVNIFNINAINREIVILTSYCHAIYLYSIIGKNLFTIRPMWVSKEWFSIWSGYFAQNWFLLHYHSLLSEQPKYVKLLPRNRYGSQILSQWEAGICNFLIIMIS